MIINAEIAITIGSPDQRLSWPNTKIGMVASAPAKKCAITTSSREIVNPINSATKIPGMMRGRVILLKVVNSLAPRSQAASSRDLSKPISLAIRIRVQAGRLKRIWPIIIVNRESSISNILRRKIRIPIPSTIAGKNQGNSIE